MGQIAGPIGGALIGGLASGKGGKKSAKGSRPELPGFLSPSVTSALGLLTSRLQEGFPKFLGPRVAPLTTDQRQLLAAGQGGLLDALQTLRLGATTGLAQEDIRLIGETLQPFFGQQERDITAQTRETEAQRGTFFGTGGVRAEADALSRLAGVRAQIVPQLAFQVGAQRIQAAQSLPGFVTQSLQPGELPRGIQQQRFDVGFQEFLRTLPENAIPLLAQLFGAPVGFNPLAPNALQDIGANISQLFSSPGFLSILQNKGGGDGGGGQPPSGFNPGAGKEPGGKNI